MILEIELLLVLICELQSFILVAGCFNSIFVGLNKLGMMTARSIN